MGTAKLLTDLEEQLKPLNAPADLVALGLAGSTKTLSNKRYEGKGPNFLRLNGSILYPKSAILEWLRNEAVFVRQCS